MVRLVIWDANVPIMTSLQWLTKISWLTPLQSHHISCDFKNYRVTMLCEISSSFASGLFHIVAYNYVLQNYSFVLSSLVDKTTRYVCECHKPQYISLQHFIWRDFWQISGLLSKIVFNECFWTPLGKNSLTHSTSINVVIVNKWCPRFFNTVGFFVCLFLFGLVCCCCWCPSMPGAPLIQR